MANEPHTDIERLALFTTALRLARKGLGSEANGLHTFSKMRSGNLTEEA